MRKHVRAAFAALIVILSGVPAIAQTARTGVDTARPSDTGYAEQIKNAKHAMMADPERALHYAKAAISIARAQPPSVERSVALSTGLWLQAEALTRLNQPEGAAPVIEQALPLVTQAAPGSKLNGDLLMTRAAVAGMQGDIQSALVDLQKAYAIYRKLKDQRSQAIALNDIGSIYADAGDYPRVLKYYQQSAETYDGDTTLSMALQNNIGTTLREMGQYEKAEESFRKALALARQSRSALLEARILTNVASAQLDAGKLQSADATVNSALQLTSRGEARGWRPFLWGVKAQIAQARGESKTAAEYVARVFEGQRLTETTMPYREFHESAYKIYQSLGDSGRALAHLEAYKRLDDEARQLMASTNAALMAAEFDFANQELRIARLQAGQLQRDVMLAKSRARLQATMLYGLLGGSAIITGLALFAYFSIRRSRNAVHAANISLNETNAALEKALTAKTRFLATTSHEIRTPLNGILGMTQVLLTDRSVANDLRDRVQVIDGAGKIMKALVDDLLDVAKMETGQITIDATDVKLKSILTDVAQLWMAEARSKGLAVNVDLASCPENIVGDERRIRQIVFNLLSNSIKFTETGSIQLVAATQPADDGESLVIRVADTGIGIPEAQLEEIFVSFHQVDNSVTRKHGGTGLGLTICRDLARAMGGDITVESKVGVGSVFSVVLPLHRSGADDAATGTAKDGRADRPESLEQCNVLIAASNPLTQGILKATLDGKVNAVLTADDVTAALDVLQRQATHYLVIDEDVLPPEKDVANWLRGLHAGATVSILALSKNLTEIDRNSLLQEGVCQVIEKPAAPNAILRTLAEMHRSGLRSESPVLVEEDGLVSQTEQAQVAS